MPHSINNVEDPAAVLAIPTEEDLDVIRRALNREYEHVEDEYVRQESDEMSEDVGRTGSLMQELIAQLNIQEE